MATGLEMFDALDRAVKGVSIGGHLWINETDAQDLYKLTVNDLCARDLSREMAEKVYADLQAQRLEQLAEHMGLRLSIDNTKPSLLKKAAPK